MITYKQPFPSIPDFIVPVLHRVYCTPNNDQIPEIRDWLQENCITKFYTSFNKGLIEFEDDADAALFTLRWV